MTVAGKASWLYVFFGILSAGLVSIASFRLKLIEEKSELLYLSFGFYSHFFKLFVKNFLSSIKLVISLAISNKALHPIVRNVKFSQKNKFNPALLMASFNMTTGLFCIGLKDQEMLIYAIGDDYFKKFDLQKICSSLSNVNDDNLV